MTSPSTAPEISKPSLVISLDEIRAADLALKERWGVDFFHADRPLESMLDSVPDEALRASVRKAFTKAGNAVQRGGSEQAVYEVMCDPAVLGLVTSARRHYFLDSVSLAAALVRHFKIAGPLLDVGCHVGIASDLLHDLVPNEIVGLEPVLQAVMVARERLAERPRLSFVHGQMPWDSPRTFGMVLAIDIIPSSLGQRGAFLRSVSNHLEDGGIAMIVSADWVDADVAQVRRELRAAHLGYVFSDVVGGYGGMPTAFSAEGCVVLQKGGSKAFPSRVRKDMESNWDSFRDYANSASTVPREKTQSFHRARLLAQRQVATASLHE